MKIDVAVKSELSRTGRVKQIEALFDIPPSERCELKWNGEIPIESFDWNVGLIVGPSGCGKSTILREGFGECKTFDWKAASVIDDFDKSISIESVAGVCQAVGFNTIPAWLRPFRVLSNGEQFRVTLARHLLEGNDPIVIDEFTSVVDRQVAQIGAHAVQKHVRKTGKKLIVASCHYDILDWLQPDWVLEPATMSFSRRSLQRRPTLEAAISRVPYAAWRLFAPFHYLTAELNKSARCFALFVNEHITSFAGVLYRPHPKVTDVMGLSRLVTLPDWQGLGLAMILSEKLGAAYKAIGKRFHTYPAHPALIRAFDRSTQWVLVKKPGRISATAGRSTSGKEMKSSSMPSAFGGRACAVFCYAGSAIERKQAEALIG